MNSKFPLHKHFSELFNNKNLNENIKKIREDNMKSINFINSYEIFNNYITNTIDSSIAGGVGNIEDIKKNTISYKDENNKNDNIFEYENNYVYDNHQVEDENEIQRKNRKNLNAIHNINESIIERPIKNSLNFYVNLQNETNRKRKEEKEIDFIYKKIFDKKNERKISNNNLKSNMKTGKSFKSKGKTTMNMSIKDRENKKKNEEAYKEDKNILDKITSINSKIFFMKSVYDYTYPHFIIKRLNEQDKMFRKKNFNLKLASLEKEKKIKEKGKFRIEELIQQMDKFGIPDINNNFNYIRDDY